MNEAAIYRFAGEMVDLGSRMLGEAERSKDPVMNDEGFELIERARYLVRDHLTYVDRKESETHRRRPSMKRETIIASLKRKIAEYPPEADNAFDAGYIAALRFALGMLEDEEENKEEGR